MTIPGGYRLAAFLLAAAVGLSGGAVTAFVAPDVLGNGDRREATPSPPGIEDPLGIGVPLENVDCTDDTLIMVGWGDLYSALSSAVADWPDVKYLETQKSCDTAYPRVRGKTPRYVAYLPPFDTPAAACEARMTARHKGDFASRMRSGNKVEVPCACELEVSTLPAIGEGQPLTTESGMWISLYQGMLADIGLNPANERSGRFDAATTDATRLLQTDAALNPTGIVDPDTWNVVRDKACRRYDY